MIHNDEAQHQWANKHSSLEVCNGSVAVSSKSTIRTGVYNELLCLRRCAQLDAMNVVKPAQSSCYCLSMFKNKSQLAYSNTVAFIEY